MKAWRVMSATRTILLTMSRPLSVRKCLALASTIATSLSCGK